MDVHRLLRNRSTGTKSLLDASYVARILPTQMQEHEINLGRDMNKVFASCWLDDDRVLCGTKCNKLLIADVVRSQITPVETLEDSSASMMTKDQDGHVVVRTPEGGLILSTADEQLYLSDRLSCHNRPCGIHDIDVSPSREFLATGGSNTNDVAVYRLPSVEPYCVGRGHSNWIFSISWLDDHLLVSGSRDGTICLWCTGILPNSGCEGCRHINSVPPDEFGLRSTTPVLQKNLPERNHRVRALNYDSNVETLAALSLSYDPTVERFAVPPRSQAASISLWDASIFRMKRTVRLPYHEENVSLARHPDMHLYANGSQNHVTFLDERDKQVTSILAPDHQLNPGVRSLSFCDSILTIGGGRGKVAFYDIRAFRTRILGKRSFVSSSFDVVLILAFKQRRDVNYVENYTGQPPPENAIYTHCYDSTHRRLFTAGGPHQAGLFGNYAALWQ